jgi:hypothetical protein
MLINAPALRVDLLGNLLKVRRVYAGRYAAKVVKYEAIPEFADMTLIKHSMRQPNQASRHRHGAVSERAFGALPYPARRLETSILDEIFAWRQATMMPREEAEEIPRLVS